MKKTFYLLCLLTTVISCRKPYTPKAILNPPHYLVIEGTILSGADSTIFKLSRTVSLSSGTSTNPVIGAQVTVESAGSNISLTELKPGYYFAPPQNLDLSQQYQLRVVLADNSTYLSDFVTVKSTPPIDSIGFTAQNTGLQLYVNTHDPNNNTRYYQWKYEETWQFHAEFQSVFITNGTTLVHRPDAQQIFNCFAGDVPSTILVGSSAKLSQDVIYQTPLIFIPSTSEKIEMRYSILLKQYSLTNDAFIFWTNLKKNSEQLGSIFDAQPSQINGNIHNINNPNETVFGFVSACTVQSKRIYINNSSLPQNWRTKYPYDCEIDSFWYKNPKTKENQVAEWLIPLNSTQIPLVYFPDVYPPLGFLAARPECADCTIRGTTQAPSFWQ